jgi:hypothetical protein
MPNENSTEKPLVFARERGNGIIDIKIEPLTALNSLRSHIDQKRTPSTNVIMPTIGHISLRLGYKVKLEEILSEFADVQYRNEDSINS